MRSSVAYFSLAVFAGAHSTTSQAMAGPMDPSLSRLVSNPQCREDSALGPCEPSQSMFHRLVSQWGAAVASGARGSGRVLGARDSMTAVSVSVTDIESSAEYWALGSKGQPVSASRNATPAKLLSKYAASVHKGLGFGLQVSGHLGVMAQTQAVVWGVDLRQGLLEGLEQFLPAYWPNVSVGLSVRKVTGFTQLSLDTQSVDVRASRTFVLAGSHGVTPWLGWQWLRIVGESELVDFTPAIDAVDDQANTSRFESANVYRHRAQVGLDYRREKWLAGLQLGTDLIKPGAAQRNDEIDKSLRCVDAPSSCVVAGRQWALNIEVGVVF